MEQKLLDKLMDISDEERDILNGNVTVSKDIYSTDAGFVVNARKLVPPGSLIVVRTHTRFIHFPPHTHNYVEIVYMYNGTTTHIINGEHRITMQPGEFLFISRNASHEILPADKNDIAVNFIILPRFFDKALSMMEGKNILGDFIAGSVTGADSPVSHLHFRTGNVLTVKNLAENLIWSLTNKENYQYSINQITMGLLFQHLLNNTDKLSQTLPDSAGYEHNIVMDVLRYIEDDYTGASLSEYAARANLPLYQLSRMVSRHTGKSFKELLLNRRMAQAEFLLRATSMPIEEIIPEIGYENSSYFFRAFKGRHGMTPREYRLSHQAI
ncbi:MAG: AraC family transcriptional regulator [Clostridiales Family XIII bacterium]|jgi:AraC-like DNA-binding protein|nr:AraC family transcriptional regulator [Clostridiales Family XIII bacterium]